jgi:hypothetical protein
MFIHCNDNFEDFDGPLTPLSDASALSGNSSPHWDAEKGHSHDAPPFLEYRNPSPPFTTSLEEAPTFSEVPNAEPYSVCDLCFLQKRRV